MWVGWLLLPVMAWLAYRVFKAGHGFWGVIWSLCLIASCTSVVTATVQRERTVCLAFRQQTNPCGETPLPSAATTLPAPIVKSRYEGCVKLNDILLPDAKVESERSDTRAQFLALANDLDSVDPAQASNLRALAQSRDEQSQKAGVDMAFSHCVHDVGWRP